MNPVELALDMSTPGDRLEVYVKQLASITLAFGDDDGNGQMDVSVHMALFGATTPFGLVFNLPMLDAQKAAAGVAHLLGMDKATMQNRISSVTNALAGITPPAAQPVVIVKPPTPATPAVIAQAAKS